MNDLFGTEEFIQQYEVNVYTLGGIDLKIREFTFHRLNGNQVWPGNQIFADFLMQNYATLQGKQLLELGSGSGILTIFLAKHGLSITASDVPDAEIFENILYNCQLNQIAPIPTLPHLWGDILPPSQCNFDMILASDILIYLKEFPKLIITLTQVLKENTVMWLNNRRRIDTEETFLALCRDSGFRVSEIFPKIFEIKK